LLNLGNSAEIDVDTRQLIETRTSGVRVRIYETWRHCHTFGIDHFRARAYKVTHIVSGPDCAETTMFHCESLGRRLSGFDRVDTRV
jgi:hypothetical protein